MGKSNLTATVPQVIDTIISTSTFTDKRLWGEGTHLESPSHYYDYSAVFHIGAISQDWSHCHSCNTQTVASIM